ncbi:MAG: hypothetical protein MJA83_15390, partial [Gammaproteobacteria bacterium]|nr:hypothetical protein [Gammaproteobacteria bacterium]
AARRKRSILLRSLGLTSGILNKMLAIEHGTVGLVAGIVGIAGAHIGATLIFQYQFAIPYQGDIFIYLTLPLLSALTFILLGYALNRDHNRYPPISLLQQP